MPKKAGSIRQEHPADVIKRGKGRPQKEPTTVIRVPTRLLKKIRALIAAAPQPVQKVSNSTGLNSVPQDVIEQVAAALDYAHTANFKWSANRIGARNLAGEALTALAPYRNKGVW